MKKYIYANLKRFDITTENAGLNSFAAPKEWGQYLAKEVNERLVEAGFPIECVMFFPEAHIIPALSQMGDSKGFQMGCQGVYRKDTEKGKNFGAFTTQRTAKSMMALGCNFTVIGHCEERADKAEIMSLGGGINDDAINKLLNEEVLQAQSAGMTVLYCIGEKEEEQQRWESVIKNQLEIGLKGAQMDKVRIAYEPVWAIGPGKPVPDAQYIQKIARLVKQCCPNVPLIYGGGLKKENAQMIASVKEVDGGLVGLTRFTGEIGFFPNEFIEIIDEYLAVANH